MSHDYSLAALIKNHIARKTLNLEVEFLVCDLARDCPIRIKTVVGSPMVSVIHLPCRVPVKTMLPDKKMLVFMQLQERPTKRAKPSDWLTLIDKALEKNFPEHLVVQK